MSYTIITKGTTISAEELNNNFDFLGAGDLMPRTGNSLTADVAGTSNLGDDSYRFKTVYCNDIDMTGEFSKAFNLIAEETVDGTVTTISFSGLSGDTDEVYIVCCHAKISAPAASFRTYLSFNQDTGTNYGYQLIAGRDAAMNKARTTTSEGIQTNFHYTGITTSAQVSHSDSIIYAKSGHERTSLTDGGENMASDYIERVTLLGNIWNNTADEVTSIVLWNSGGQRFHTGTNVQLWAKR